MTSLPDIHHHLQQVAGSSPSSTVLGGIGGTTPRRKATTKSSSTELQFVLAKYGLNSHGDLPANNNNNNNNNSSSTSTGGSGSGSSSSGHSIIKSGFLMKQGMKWKSWKKRLFVLIDDILIYKKVSSSDSSSHHSGNNANSSSSSSSGSESKVIGLLQLQNGTITLDEKNRRMFHVKCDKSFSKDNVFSERSYTFQLCSEDSDDEREDWAQKLKRSATQHVRSRMRTRTRAGGQNPLTCSSPFGGSSSAQQQDVKSTSTSAAAVKKSVAVVVTNATSNVGIEVVKSLLLRKIRVIAICHPSRRRESSSSSSIPTTSPQQSSEQPSRKNSTTATTSTATTTKENLLKNYGAQVICLEGGFRNFESISLVEQINARQYHIATIVHIPLDGERLQEDMNQAINFSLQLSINSFILCSKYFPVVSSSGGGLDEQDVIIPQLFDEHLQCEQTVKSYFGNSCTIFRYNGTMQDFLLFYDEKTRTFYFPFGDLQEKEDSAKKRVSWVDARDVGLAICTTIMNILFQVSSQLSKSKNSTNSSIENRKSSHTHVMSGPESLTILDVIKKFSKKTNVPVEYKVVDRDVSMHRLMNLKGLSKWECEALHDVYSTIYDEGLAATVFPDLHELKGSAATIFDNFIERELETFQDHNPCICMIGSIHFIQSKLLHALHDMNFISKNVIFSKKEIPDYPFKTAQYIIFDYEKEKKTVEIQLRSQMTEEQRRRRTEEILASSSMINVSFRASRSASIMDLEGEDFVESKTKSILTEKFVDYASDAVMQSEKLLFFIKAKYLLNKWFDLDAFKKIMDNAARSTKLKHIFLLYDSSTKRICSDFLTQVSIYLSRKCKVAYTFIEFGWLYQTLATLSGSELQTFSSLSLPTSSTIDTLNERLEWCDGDDVIEFILHLMRTIKVDSEQLIKNFVAHGVKASFREIARIMSEVLKKPISCAAIDINKAFPCLCTDQKEIFEHRAIKKEMVYYLTFAKDSEAIDYSSDILEFDMVMGKKLKTLKEFVENSLISFSDIVELQGSEFEFYTEIGKCQSVDEQEQVIFKHLFSKCQNTESLFNRVLTQQSDMFVEAYSLEYFDKLTSEEKVVATSRAKSLISTFFDDMYKVMSRQVQKIIISPSVNFNVNLKVVPNEMEPLFAQCVDYVFFDKIFPIVFQLYKRELTEKAEFVNQKYVELKNCTPRHLEIADEYCLEGNGKTSDENYAHAIQTLSQISTCNNLIDGKMKILMNTSKAIVDCVKNFYGKPKEVSADALMPIFIFVMIKAAIPDLYCHLKILEDFVHESLMMGPMGYSLVTLQIAVDYMQTLNWEQLDQMFRVQMELKKQQEEFRKRRDSEIQFRKTRGLSVMLNKPPEAIGEEGVENQYTTEDAVDQDDGANMFEPQGKSAHYRSMSVFNSRRTGSVSAINEEDDEEDSSSSSGSPPQTAIDLPSPTIAVVADKSDVALSPKNNNNIIPQTPDRLFEDDVFAVVEQSPSTVSVLSSAAGEQNQSAESILSLSTLSARQAVELTVLLLEKIVEIYRASEWINQTNQGDGQERMGWGKQLTLGKEFIILADQEDKLSQFTELTYKLESIDLAQLKSKKHLITIFLINLYHVMLLHGFIRGGFYPMLNTSSRRRFMKEPIYCVGSIPLSLDDIYCLLTSCRNISNLEKHKLLSDVYQNDPLNCLAISNCSFSSPPIRVYYPNHPELIKTQLKQQATSVLLQYTQFNPQTKVLVLPSMFASHLALFGDNKETVMNWIINMLPKDADIRKDLSITMAYANIHIKFSPIDHSFQFKILE